MSADHASGPDTGFKLFGLVKEVLAESGETDTDQLALEVLERIPTYDRETALYQALRQLVRTGFRPAFIPASTADGTASEKDGARTATSEPTPERDGRQWMPTVVPKRDDGPSGSTVRHSSQTPHPAPAPPVPPKPSAKVAAIREAWRRSLMQRIAIGDGKHKFLGDCTAYDLEFAAQAREEHAKRTEARAGELRRLVALMREHGATHLSDLPAEVLADAPLNGAA